MALGLDNDAVLAGYMLDPMSVMLVEMLEHGSKNKCDNFFYILHGEAGNETHLPVQVKRDIASRTYHGSTLEEGNHDRGHPGSIFAAAAAAPNTKSLLAKLTFREICCCFGLSLTLIMDNDVRFNNGLWKILWKMCGSKLKFTSSYNPQSDPALRANRQVMEALRAAVATVVQYDEWDLALPLTLMPDLLPSCRQLSLHMDSQHG